MRYRSTRGGGYADDKGAILQGMAPDGGLYVPEHFPELDWGWSALSYSDLAAEVLGLYFPSLRAHMGDIVSPYLRKFPSEPVRVTPGREATILELYHGPTLAFKDMALSILPKLMEYSLPEGKRLHILTATSGDTGKAALEGFADVARTRITVFFPEGKVSPIQARQMLTQPGANVAVFPVVGNFDDCQRGVKEIFADRELAERLSAEGVMLSSANSINIGRLVPQIVYYLYAYFQMEKKGQIARGEKLNICVPTGNFGNILAAYYAKRMGLPVDRLICANNQNRVLTDFFHEKKYSAKRDLSLTSSPSMDILVSSNLERLLYHLQGEEAVRRAMGALEATREYTWDALPEDFRAYTLEEEACSRVIAHGFRQGLLLDPHTAVGYGAAMEFQRESGGKVLVASTASPYKFPQKVLESLGVEVEANPFAQVRQLSEHTRTALPEAISALEVAALRPHRVIEYEQMRGVIQ